MPNAQLGETIAKAARSVRRTVDRIRRSIIENPLAWFLAALLLAVEYESHQRGRDLDRVCELFGPHDASYGHPATPREEKTRFAIVGSRTMMNLGTRSGKTIRFVGLLR
jgi:hypothetical protein